jgi:hypothetical protein
MSIQDYLTKLNTLYITGNAREHSYRGDLQNLLMYILPGVLVTNEPARVACGAPDYVLTRKDIPLGYIEAKDIGIDLNSKTFKEQFERYKSGLNNLIFTDYLDFHFYKDGVLTTKVTIGKLEEGKITALPKNFEQFTQLIKNFAETITQTIKSPTRLAEMMAGKAKLMADVIEKSLQHDDTTDTISNLKTQMLSFQDMLIHDIDNKSFADIYAQTIAYGMFAARYHDPTLENFSREEAATLIPKSNPFLRKLFHDIAGYDVDDRLVWIVDELVRIFLASDVASIMKNFGKSTKQEDPVVHFYETFLASYSPALRKARGVWYTPQPVVNFIVRAVDDILKTEFNLKDGLADRSKIKVKVKAPKLDNRSKNTSKIIGEQEIEKEYHKVQILDPATGTGTFLAEVVRHIHKKFEGQQGIWSKYVNNDLIPRLNGFELLMASYAMAHLKMDMLLTETGYKPENDQRFRIFLTNSLEEHHKDTGTLFSHWLADEANQANAIKRDAPVMVVIGNPPYSGESSNRSEWIMNLMEDYKKEPGGKIKLKERNSKFINDDYVKFLRFGQHFINKNEEGILAFINPHGFLDNPTFRGMRWSLLNTYNKIYTIDLHGNTKNKEIIPDNIIDKNVFDIQQGVSINIFIKSKPKNKIGDVYHYDLYGKREYKYNFLSSNSLNTIKFKKLNHSSPNYSFRPTNKNLFESYELSISLNELFIKKTIGIQTHRDELVIDFDRENLNEKITTLFEQNLELSKSKFNIKESKDWNLNNAITKAKKFTLTDNKQITYRPFDTRFIYYNDYFVDRTRKAVGNEINENNYVINFPKIVKVNWNHALITKSISTAVSLDINGTYFAPLYLDISNNQLLRESEHYRTPNFNPEIIKLISKNLGLEFVHEKEDNITAFAPIDLLDYIYAILHSPSYREKYKEFLKIDFPRVPYPTDAKKFWKLVKLGGEIRQIHLLESDIVEKPITQYPEDGDNVVTKPLYKDGNVYINEKQYFSNIPEVAWNFYIGGYQPAQKWLKDRKGRELNYEDIFHYQKIIVALTETDRIMKEIDKIEI